MLMIWHPIRTCQNDCKNQNNIKQETKTHLSLKLHLLSIIIFEKVVGPRLKWHEQTKFDYRLCFELEPKYPSWTKCCPSKPEEQSPFFPHLTSLPHRNLRVGWELLSLNLLQSLGNKIFTVLLESQTLGDTEQRKDSKPKVTSRQGIFNLLWSRLGRGQVCAACTQS